MFTMAALIFAALILALGFLGGCSQQSLDEQKYAYHENIYVANRGSNTVTVIDVFAFNAIKTIAVGNAPSALAANPRKNEIYVANTESNNVSVINAETNAVVSTIGVHRAPVWISVSADGKRAYVVNSGSNNVSIIDLDARKVLATVGVGVGPAKAAVSPDGKSIAVSLRGENAVSVIDGQRAQVRTKVAIPDCQQPDSVTVLPDSTKAFVACSGSSQVAAVQLKKSAAKQDDDRLLTLLNVGKSPVHLALKPDGGEIFVSNADSGTFSEIATQANEVGGSYLVGERPAQGVVANDNATLYVSNTDSNTVAAYDITISRLLKAVHVGSKPVSLVLSPNENYLYVANTGSSDVSVIRTKVANTAAQELFTMIPVGKDPTAMVAKAFAVKR